ncbi:ABC transporter substrate-binding protein [Fervidibacillus halotolerans]|uniref:ABC transporter substrate-binding protein n=1 Tax=Fervidibacillus halotolerans TaxID=2980027 RepID=A0A9E8RYR4_9BACI|nr:ABC transporter substrate-binding protein [Fervidibacillus halotolerans]WAA13096.1 ABC transporter substrate-binding protein [Fervidibacillus halotolerans]
MKKAFSIFMVLLLMVSLAACGGNSEDGDGDSNKLVIYTPNSEDMLNLLIPMFEEETGIEVELVTAGTGELIKRLESEKDNPYADVLFGGSKAQVLNYPELFEEYVSVNNDDMLEGHKNVDGFLTPYTADGSVILVNTDLIGDIEINGYADLLNPELKGKIIGADPLSSSSAFAHLTNMLLAMGGYESDEAWDYVKQLLEIMDGKVASSSGAVHKGVADGEYVVGLTYEDPAASYVLDGAPVEVVYMEEGTVFLDAGVEIIKGANNLENAKKFIDFVTSKAAQDALGGELTNRPLRADAEVGDHMVPYEEINVIMEDEEYVKNNRDKILERYTEVFTDVQE